MTADVTIKDGARLTPHPLRAAVLGEVHARPFTPIETPRRILHFAFDTAGEAAKADRAALADFCARRELEPLQAGGQAASRRARRRHAALGAALRIYHLYLGAAVAGRHAVPSRRRVAGGADGEPAAAGAAAGGARSASDGGTRKDRARAAVRPRQPGGGGECRRRRAVRHRLPGRSGRLRAHPGARPRLGTRARRRAGAAHRRTGNLPHAGAARPARGAAADAVDQPHRDAARRSHRGNAAHRQTDRQSPPARRIDRARRRTGSGRGGEPVPLRRQPRL